MTTAYTRTVEPTPVLDVAAVVSYRRMNDGDASDADRWIRSATDAAEAYLRRGLLTQTWKYAQDAFTDEIWLPMAAPLQSVTSVKYYDSNGVLQTLSTSVYLVDTLSEPGRVLLAPSQSWPSTQARPLAVEIVYVVGWTAPDLVPGPILDGLYLLIGDRDAFREDSSETPVSKVANHAEAIWSPYRVWCPEPCLS